MTTNAHVAARFASAAKNSVGTAMRSLGVGTNMSARNPTLSQQTSIDLESDGHFDVLAIGYSYTTEVAQLVHNNHTNNVELWMHVSAFSPTTKQHKSLYLQAFHLEMQKLGKTTEEIVSRVYRTGCFEQGYRTRQKWSDKSRSHFNALTKPHRAEACQYGMDFDHAMNSLEEAATRPRLHDATRFALLHDARAHLERCIRNVSQDVNPSSVIALSHDNPEFLDACRNVLDFIFVVSEYPLKQMRVATAGFIALHTNN